MSEIKVNNIQSLSGTNGPVISGTVEMNSTGAMALPRGDTAYRGGRGRGVFAGGYTPTNQNVIDYVTIATTGNAKDFGDLTAAKSGNTCCASSTRGISAGGRTPSPTLDVIEYITIPSTGNAFDFGDLLTISRYSVALSDSTRGVISGGYSDGDPDLDTFSRIQYVTIASKGNASAFGNLEFSARAQSAAASPTRGIVSGGTNNTSGSRVNTIQYITISTLGDAQDFGDLTETRASGQGGCSNSTRGVVAGGSTPAKSNVIDYVTIASTGDAIDFGDLTAELDSIASGGASPIRGIFGGGRNPSSTVVNTIQYITISTLGNAQDFGDLSVTRRTGGGCSDSHGGLG